MANNNDYGVFGFNNSNEEGSFGSGVGSSSPAWASIDDNPVHSTPPRWLTSDYDPALSTSAWTGAFYGQAQ
ncbi:MAG: hypothetical protein MMC33_001260 [Icmadophila ericetorum]|nr:hypothetical protein [Icmadophila ericetorum]